MNTTSELLDKKLFLAIPTLLGIFLYLNMYVASFFTGQEYFSIQSLILQIGKLYFYWYISSNIFYLTNNSTATNFLFSVLAITIISVVTAASYKQFLIITDPQNDSLNWIHFANYGTHGIIVALTVTLLAMLVMIMKKQQQVMLQNAQLEKATVKAQLHALQTQVKPHFLFNNLNTLQSMIETKNIKAQNFLKDLSDLFRQILKYQDNQLIPLKEELEFCELFSRLLKGRFNDNLTIDIQLESIENLYLPPFTLQMLLENVIKHNRIDESHRISCRIIQTGEVITVENNLHHKKSNHNSTEVGLENLKRRYALLSDKTIDIQRITTEQGVMFKVAVPALRVAEYD